MSTMLLPAPPAGLRRVWGRIFAAVYDTLLRCTEEEGNRDRRAAVLAHARGTVVELGAGTGLNLEHYPGDVDLVLTEPEAPMARRLEERVAAAGRRARVVQAPAERLPFPDASADTVVSTLVLCTVKDLRGTLAEIRRVLGPGGRLLFIEHVAAEAGTRLRRWQDRLHRPWHAIAHGCHTNRDTVRAMTEAGFAFDQLERGELEKAALVRPLVWGVAR